MKLELKHLAPYLPYGLKMYYEPFVNARETDIWLLSTWAIDQALDFQNKPILRPLYDIDKKMIEDIAEKCLLNEDQLNLLDLQTRPSVAKVGINTMLPYSVVTYLLERHYDLFGLINSNKAIDFNTINR